MQNRLPTQLAVIPQTVLALWGSGVFKAGDPPPGFPASRTFADIRGHGENRSDEPTSVVLRQIPTKNYIFLVFFVPQTVLALWGSGVFKGW